MHTGFSNITYKNKHRHSHGSPVVTGVGDIGVEEGVGVDVEIAE